MMEDLIAQYLERALEQRAEGETVDLAKLCEQHPECIPEVERLLRIDRLLEDDHGDEAPSDPLLGSVLGERYELLECIGVGAMGAVYRAKDRTLQREVAVKLLQNGLFASPERHERFVREARVLASLRHANIVEVFDHGRVDGGVHYIVMECLVGVPMAQILQQAEVDTAAGDRRLDSEWLLKHFDVEVPGLSYLPQAVYWCRQVAGALVEAHREGIAHRDVKPTNVFIDRSGAAILLDFGIAAKHGDGSLTAQGSTVGSPWYMAPEQAGGERGGTQQARELVDVYGLCATLYHLVTLRPPYEGDYASVLVQLGERDPVPPGAVRPELSRDLCAVIEKGMERDPARRYASMQELGADLQALYEQLPVVARPIGKVGRWARSVRRRPAPYLAAIAMVVAVAVTIPAVSWMRDNAHAQSEATRSALLAAKSRLAPPIAFEGSFEMRPNLDPDDRARYLAQLAEVLRIDPEDLFARLVRSGLLLDAGELAASLADIEWIANRHESPFMQAMRRRHASIDASKPGVLGLDLEGLPAPQTDPDRVVLGFQLYRHKLIADADRVLAGSDSEHARNLRLGSMRTLGEKQWYGEGDRSILEELFVEADMLERQQGGATARSLYYRGAAMMLLKQWQPAVATLERSRRLCPDSYGTHWNLGGARLQLSQFQLAREATEMAHKLRPGNFNAVTQLASILAELGEFDRATVLVEKLPASGHLLEPWHRPFYLGFVEALHATDLFGRSRVGEWRAREAAALSHYQAALALVPDGSFDQDQIRWNMSVLLVEADPLARVAVLLTQLNEQPGSRLYMLALKAAFDDSGLVDDPDLRRAFGLFFERQIRRVFPPAPVDAGKPK